MAPIKIVLAGIPKPYRERQRAFQAGRDGTPITYSYKTTPTRTYQTWLRQAAQEAMNGAPPLDGPVSLTMTAYMPIPKTALRKAERALAEQELLPARQAAGHHAAAQGDRRRAHPGGLDRRRSGRRAPPRQALLAASAARA